MRECYLILGGAGLVGFQVARQVAARFSPRKIVIASLHEAETTEAVAALRRELPPGPDAPELVGELGNVFVREAFARLSRAEILGDAARLEQVFRDVYRPLVMSEDLIGAADRDRFDSEEAFREAYENIGNQSQLVRLIKRHRPDVVVDCINTATGISYQDVQTASEIVKRVRDGLGAELGAPAPASAADLDEATARELAGRYLAMRDRATRVLEEGFDALTSVDVLLVSAGIPQLIRHVLLIHGAMRHVGTRVYVKVGTTGTGGMGVEIPFTHGEDRPSFTLLAKSSVGFAHTGLLFLLGRSEGPTIKEIKPAAMIGYRRVDWQRVTKFGRPVLVTIAKSETLGEQLELRAPAGDYEARGPLELVGVDTGENGFFTRGEFEAITHLHQMEFLTPEEIARSVVHEIAGQSTGHDVIGAIDSTVMDPSYRAGYLRQAAIDKMAALEREKGVPSIAIGQLGPPQLSKLLYEAHLLKITCDTLDGALALTPEEIAARCVAHLDAEGIDHTITSLGLPILMPDGLTIRRGPTISIPESKVDPVVAVRSPADVDAWAKQGWVDLRPANFARWRGRFEQMRASQRSFEMEGSAAYGIGSYLYERIRVGEVVGWIFNNELGGHRIK